MSSSKEQDNCACPADNAPKRKSLKEIFRKCALCAGSGAGGLLAGHAGCIITPVVIAAAGATSLTAGLPLLALAFSTAATAGGLYAWHRLRGKTAGKWEKRIVVGSALAGVLLSSAFHLAGHRQSHQNMAMPDAIICGQPKNITPPPPAATHLNH